MEGQTLLLDALAEMGGQVDRLRVVMAGDAPPGQEHFTESLDAAIAGKAFSDRVTRIPFTDDLPTLLAAADVCAVPSTRPEPFGMVAIESMAAGTAVVAAEHGGLTEIVQDQVTGRLFEPGSAIALAAALSDVLSNDVERQRMGLEAQRLQAERFSALRYRSRVLSVYDDLTARAGKPRRATSGSRAA